MTHSKLSCTALVFALCMAAGCRHEYIPEDTMAEILADMHFTDALMAERKDKAPLTYRDTIAIYRPIVERYGFTLSQLNPSMMQLNLKKNGMQDLYVKVNAILERRRSEYENILSLQRAEEDIMLGIDRENNLCR